MSGDPLAGLRRLLPVLFLVILVQAGLFVWAVWGGRAVAQPALRAVVAADLSVTAVTAFVLWRLLGRRR